MVAMSTQPELTRDEARRLAVTAQRLAGPRPQPDATGIMETVHALGCLQIDAVRAVEQTQYLVLWSRLGPYDPAELDRLTFDEAQLFEYWAHCASIVPATDYPLHTARMRHYRTRAHASNTWIDANPRLYRHIIDRLRIDGPLPTDAFDDLADVPWQSSGWNDNRNPAMMLSLLWARGEVMIAGRAQRRRLWQLTEHYLPAEVRQETLTDAEIEHRAVVRALEALGVGTARHVREHFLRGRYPNLAETLDALVDDGTVQPVTVHDADGSPLGKEPWYMATSRRPDLARIRAGAWTPRTTLLSPFDNLICDRTRTAQLFDFDYRVEIYVPKAKRQFGYYVLPILHGDRFIGRLDLQMDRKQHRLVVNAGYREADAPDDETTAAQVAAAITSLAGFLDAAAVDVTGPMPAPWQRALT